MSESLPTTVARPTDGIPDALLASMGDRVDVIKFKAMCNNYRANEEAGFPPIMAERFVNAGVAYYVARDVPRAGTPPAGVIAPGGEGDGRRAPARGQGR